MLFKPCLAPNHGGEVEFYPVNHMEPVKGLSKGGDKKDQICILESSFW